MKTKFWIFFSLGFLFAAITFILNQKAYLGILTLLPGIIAMLFSFLCLRIAKQKKIFRVMSFLITILSLAAFASFLIGELGKKHKDKVEFIEDFSKEIDNQLDQVEKDSIDN